MNFEEWVGVPIAGQPADAEVEIVDADAGQPASSDGSGKGYDDADVIPATEGELRLALGDAQPQIIGNPQGNLQSASDLPRDIQDECGICDDNHVVLVVATHERTPSRQAWVRVQRAPDDDEEWEAG